MENTSGEKGSFVRGLLKVQWIAETVLAVILALMVLVVFLGVVMRYVFNSSIASAEELSRVLFIWMVFIGVVLILVRNRHVAFDAIQEAASPPVKRILKAVTLLGIAVSALILTVYGYQYSEQNFAWPSPGLLIPFGYISLILPISGAAMFVIAIAKLVELFIPGKGAK